MLVETVAIRLAKRKKYRKAEEGERSLCERTKDERVSKA